MNGKGACLVLVLACGAPAAAQELPQPQGPVVTVLSKPTAGPNIDLWNDHRKIRVKTQFTKISIHHPKYEDQFAYILMLRDPRTGLYWWMYQNSYEPVNELRGPSLTWDVHFTDDKAVGFWRSRGHIVIREVRGRKPDFAAIQQAALADLEPFFRKYDSALLPGDHDLEVGRDIGADFFSIPGHAEAGLVQQVLLTHTADRWTMTLKGPNREFAELTFDEQYALKQVRRFPAPQ